MLADVIKKYPAAADYKWADYKDLVKKKIRRDAGDKEKSDDKLGRKFTRKNINLQVKGQQITGRKDTLPFTVLHQSKTGRQSSTMLTSERNTWSPKQSIWKGVRSRTWHSRNCDWK